jgi:hypothetical protein
VSFAGEKTCLCCIFVALRAFELLAEQHDGGVFSGPELLAEQHDGGENTVLTAFLLAVQHDGGVFLGPELLAEQHDGGENTVLTALFTSGATRWRCLFGA